jgi:pimeloyl-ACP methyl ester carboxylesterase
MKSVIYVVLSFFSVISWGQTQIGQTGVEQFVTLKNGHKLFVRYTPPQKNMPVLVFVNGLTYSTNDYSQVTRPLEKRGYGTFLYDAYGMGRTLLENPIPTAPIDYEDQIKDLNELLGKMKIQAPYNMVGLSYGGGILIGYGVRYPKKIANLFLMSPYTEVIESSKNIILKQIEYTKLFFPFNDATDEELANFFIRMFAYQNYPIYEPTVLENPYKLEGVIRLTQGITPYRPVDEAKSLPANTVHLMIGYYDQYVTKDVYDAFWLAVLPASPCSYLNVNFSEHKLPQSYPLLVSRWIHANIKSKKYCTGSEYLVNPFTGYMLPDEGAGVYLPELED